MPVSTSASAIIPFGKITLAGTLHRPHASPVEDTDAEIPAIVMIAGSGPSDRDSYGYFTPIRNAFLAAGLAVLSWDKPGIGESTGAWTNQTFFDRADEAITALSWLRTQPGIDAIRTGIWGHSQGGWVGPIAAAKDANVAFLIINSGPGIDVIAQDLFGIEHILRRRGRSEAEISAARYYMDAIHDAAARDLAYEEVRSQILVPAEGSAGAEYFGEITADIWRFFCLNIQNLFTPPDALSKISCPTLALFGEEDDLVPAEESVAIIEQAFDHDDAPELVTRIFPNADHRMQIDEELVFAEGYLSTMTDWLVNVNEIRDSSPS